MDAAHLRVLAGRLNDWLNAKQHAVKHGHTLDFISAIPGLRNWPEVIAHPDRVAPAQVCDQSCLRLAQRIAKKLGVTYDSAELLIALADSMAEVALDVWPGGPAPGLYLTTSEEAVNVVIKRYEAATDGGPVYAEAAGARAATAIDLGEYGLYSNGLARLPSGSLIVIGPLQFTQDEWEDSGERLGAAANLALEVGHRIVALCSTPQPTNLYADVSLLLGNHEWTPEDVETVLKGSVTTDGSFVAWGPRPSTPVPPVAVQFVPSEPLPEHLANVLRAGLAVRQYGLVIAGSWRWKEDRAKLLEATLPFTEHAGPAARIMPNSRIDYDGNPPLLDAFYGLPVFPSAESAYASGYRRMIFEKARPGEEFLLEHLDDVCFHIATFGPIVSQALTSAVEPRLMDNPAIVGHVIAVLCSSTVEFKKSVWTFQDAMPALTGPLPAGDFEAIDKVVKTARTMRWEDQLGKALDMKFFTLRNIKKAIHALDYEWFENWRTAPRKKVVH